MSERIDFHFKGEETSNQQLPIDCMINLLSNLKDLTYLIVAQSQGIDFNERFRPSKEIKEGCIIKCEIPKKGSYTQSVSINYNIPNFNIKKPLENFLISSANNNEKEIEKIFPVPKMRKKALCYVREAFPKSEEKIYVEINNIQKNVTTIIDKITNIVEEYMTVVTGRLAGIDFEEHKMTIIHPMTKRQLDCFYNEDVESLLLENRRELVQITGKVILDDNEQPKKITDVVSIEKVDLSPIEFDSFEYNNKKLKLKKHYVFFPKLDETEQLYVIEDEKLGLNLFAYTRQELCKDIISDIYYLWEEYAKEDDKVLSEDAKILKNNLISLIEEV